MSYDYADRSFPWEMLTRLRQAGCNTTEETGLHIHVSRAGFSDDLHVYRWMKFIYRNARPVQVVARRCGSSWASFTNGAREGVKRSVKGEFHPARYSAINTRNEDTFELRMFRSSLVESEVRAALELAHASIEYTRTLTTRDIARDHGWDWSAFMAWLPDRYRNLAEEMPIAA